MRAKTRRGSNTRTSKMTPAICTLGDPSVLILYGCFARRYFEAHQGQGGRPPLQVPITPSCCLSVN
ncbi:protein of unknown function (plasmid) [Cupriavidus taiwanensis]|uniref:Uncharacterized protein n=1 Tax=Cupriavidus taiwanensis TaxID=164546 RepID=A0A375ED28_9BURK|nr:protein of unknown function [Cupriavidus taiwanensis]SOZ72297.1 protein of unknown function [Cupriavidus taiwanensis]SOZ74586.1 protein of unknown function [Cupriavidus taiwanensis]SPA11403.1 protein of unknown function [Cupriavidus taiwanensis]